VRAAVVSLAVVTALLTAGCGAVGRSTSGDPSSGKAIFVSAKARCSQCHTLADANAKGTLGPNLDDAFESSRMKQIGSFDISTIRDVIRGQIAYPEAPMPANLVRGRDADDVAAYVAKCAGVPSCGVQATGAKPAPSGGGATSGKEVFASAGCASCHTLKDAGATGKIGPNLDQLKPDKARVAKQVTNGGASMPAFKGQLSTEQIDAVAAYVSSVAGK
jgi:cbb3-type cytochrome c oxidase subunit III